MRVHRVRNLIPAPKAAQQLYLVVTPTSLILDKNGNWEDGRNTISVEVWRQKGNAAPTQADMGTYSVSVFKDGSSNVSIYKPQTPSFSFQASKSDSSFDIVLKVDSVKVETLTVTVSACGQDGDPGPRGPQGGKGDDGEHAASLEIEPQLIQFNGDEAGKVDNASKGIVARMRIGGNLGLATLTEIVEATVPSGVRFASVHTVTANRNLMKGTADLSVYSGSGNAYQQSREAGQVYISGSAGTSITRDTSQSLPVSGLASCLKIVHNSTSGDYGFAQGEVLLNTGTITMSCWIKGASGTLVRILPAWQSINGQSTVIGSLDVTCTGGWQKVTCTGTVSVANVKWRIGHVYVLTPNATVYACGLKVEYGSEATAWTDVWVDDVPTLPASPHYRVGLFSDVHSDDNNNTAKWREDMRAVLNYFASQGVEFVCSCGDIGEALSTSTTNDAATGTDVSNSSLDYYDFYEVYNEFYESHHGVSGGARLMTCLGNHDFWWLKTNDGTFKSRFPENGVFPKAYTHGNDDNVNFNLKKLSWDVFLGDESDIVFFEFDGVWNQRLGGKGRTGVSKTSYYTIKHGDIFVFLSLNYGETKSLYGYSSQAFNMLDYSNKYTAAIIDKAKEAGYNQAVDGAYDYQFYDPNTLTWLWDILENNKNNTTRIFVFTHHFLPHKTGNNQPGKTGNWYSKDRVYPYTGNPGSTTTAGANTLVGLQMYFINWLNNKYRNVMWFNGHTHTNWDAKSIDPYINFCGYDFDIVKPTETWNNRFYTRQSDTPKGKAAWNVHLPSLSRPESITNGRQNDACECAVLDVYSSYIVVRGISFNISGGTYTPVEKTRLIVRTSDNEGWIDGSGDSDGGETVSTVTVESPMTISGNTASGSITADGAKAAIDGVLKLTLRGTYGGKQYTASGNATINVVPAPSGGKPGQAGETDKVLNSVVYYFRWQYPTPPGAPTSKADADSLSTPWASSIVHPVMSMPYVWKCTITQYSVSGWVVGAVELAEVYQPQTRILTRVDWETLYRNSRSFYKGDPGEPYRDLYLDVEKTVFLAAKRTAVASDTSDPLGELRSTYWEEGSFVASLGVGLLAVLKAHVEELVVRRLETVKNENGLYTTIEGGMMRVMDAASGQSAEFGIDENGSLKLNFLKDGNLLAAYGPDDVLKYVDGGASSYVSKICPYSSESFAGTTKINLAASAKTLYLFKEGVKILTTNNEKVYRISNSKTPSIYNGKYFAEQYSESVLSNGRGVYTADGYYLFTKGVQRPDGNKEAVEKYIKDGAIQSSRRIVYSEYTNEHGFVLDSNTELIEKYV